MVQDDNGVLAIWYKCISLIWHHYRLVSSSLFVQATRSSTSFSHGSSAPRVTGTSESKINKKINKQTTKARNQQYDKINIKGFSRALHN